MKVTNSINIADNTLHKKGKVQAKQASPFGKDEVKLGNKPEEQMGLTQAQVKGFFTTQSKDILSETNWEFAKTGLSDVDYPNLIATKDGAAVSRTDNGIVKLDGKTGKALWSAKIPLNKKGVSLVETGDGTIVGSGEDNKLHGFDPKTGKQKWELDLGTKFKNPMMTADNGDLLTFRKEDDHLHLTRLNPDGTVKSTAKLGAWNEPIGDDGFEGNFINQEKNGDLIIHASTSEKVKKGKQYVPSYNMTFRVTSDGKVLWGTRNLDPAASFESDPDHFFMVSYDKMAHFDKNTGKEIFSAEKKHERYDPKYGGIGDTRFEIDGKNKYKYLKYFGAQQGRVFIQAYCEGPLRTTKSGEELLCVDAKNPDKVYWTKDSCGSVFTGPLYTDENIILHVSDEDKGIVEALDPMTGNAKWALNLADPNSGSRITGPPQGHLVPVSKENPNNYRVQKAKDGTLFIRTFKNVFGIDPNSGQIKYTVKAQNELGAFHLNDKEDTIFAVNDETQAIQAYPVSTTDEIVGRAAEKITKQEEQEGEKQDLSIKVEETQVSIGGVVLKKNK